MKHKSIESNAYTVNAILLRDKQIAPVNILCLVNRVPLQ